jgi:hypothetical protein
MTSLIIVRGIHPQLRSEPDGVRDINSNGNATEASADPRRYTTHTDSSNLVTLLVTQHAVTGVELERRSVTL